MKQEKDFSVIIPHKDSIHTLKRLFDSIPLSDRIEIILVDNSLIPITKDDIGINRDYKLLWSNPSRYAGGARNVGIDKAIGKWLIFADADDYFEENAFAEFYSEYNSKADVIYYKMTGIYLDTGEYSSRGESYSLLVKNYIEKGEEMSLRMKFISPCAKMVRREFIVNNNIYYDEVCASNDVMFSTKLGFYAKNIQARDSVVYVATVSKGTLTKRRDFEVIHSRYLVTLERNKFLRSHFLNEYQSIVLHLLYQSLGCGLSKLFVLLIESIRYRQNIFLGFSKLYSGTIKFLRSEKNNSKYIVK